MNHNITIVIINMEFEQETVCHVYNRIAERFNKTRGYTWSWIKEFIETLSKGSTVYDIGCGSGRNMQYADINFIGVDNCNNLLNICVNKGLNVLNSDMCVLPFQNESSDAIISIASFHHLSTTERRVTALKEIYRVLKPNGKLLLSVWSKQQPKKTRRTFEKYGDTMVKWDQYGDIFERYYYIFKVSELQSLFSLTNFVISKHNWQCGNEVFILKKK